MLKFFFIIFSFSIIFSSISKSDVNIVISIDKEIITNYDIQNEAKYLKAMKRYGLDKPETLKTKAQLDRAIKSFERETGIKWPFK